MSEASETCDYKNLDCFHFPSTHILIVKFAKFHDKLRKKKKIDE